jgi:hypothetical protein
MGNLQRHLTLAAFSLGSLLITTTAVNRKSLLED